jgi:alpha-mannosidase
MAELTLWDYIGDLKRLEVVDEKGQSIPFQLLDQQMQCYWEHRYVRILIRAAVPAFGYAVYAVREREMTEYTTHLYGKEETWVEQPKKGLLLENAYLAASFDPGSGQLISLTDKSSGEELLRGPAGLTLVRTEKKKMTSWNIGRYLGMEQVTCTLNVTEEKGSLRNSILFQQKVMDSAVQMRVSLDANAKALQYEFSIDWKETCNGQEYIPLLSYRMPLRKDTEGICCDVPAGCVVRKTEHIDVPALTGVCAVCPGVKPAILSNCKYGYRLADNVLSVTLINTAGDPDPYPERGIHAIKLMVALTDGTHIQMKHLSKVLMSPMIGVPTACHKGSLAPRGSLTDFRSDHSILTGMFAGADGELVLRMYEAEGRRDPVTVTLPFAPKEAVITDLDGAVIRAVELDGKKISFVAEPYELLQVKCK